MNERTILIAGAGPTGLTAAVELARRGIVPRVIDRNDRPSQLGKAVGISPRSLDILEASGVMSTRHGDVAVEDVNTGMAVNILEPI